MKINHKVSYTIINIYTQGQTLIETLVAMSVALVLLTLATVATTTALNNVQRGKNQNQASKFAEQGLEVMRQMRDADWTTFNNLSGTYCMADTCSTITNGAGVCGSTNGSCVKNIGEFSRSVLVESNIGCVLPGNNNPKIIASRVTVTVAWADNTCIDSNSLCRKTSVVSCLGNIYSDPNL
jgi:Tfp pilus assembly protein PilV